MAATRKRKTPDASKVQEDPPSLPKRKPANLSTLADIKAEMGTIYRMVWAGRITLQEATRLVYVLREMGALQVASDKADAFDELLAKIPFRGMTVIGPTIDQARPANGNGASEVYSPSSASSGS